MKKTIIFSLILMWTSLASAQLLSINDAKTKFEGSAEYRGGTPIVGNPEGKVYSHEGLWHNFIYSPMAKVGIEGHHMWNDGDKGTDNHYFRLGMNGMKVFMLPGYTRGIALTANLYVEASKYGFHHFDGVLSSLFMFSMKQNDSRGVGFIFLLNNPSKMFALPIFTWKRDWGTHWSINWMTYLGDFSYNFNKKTSLTASYGFGFDRNWVHYADADNPMGVYMTNQTIFDATLNVNWKVSKTLTLGAGGGEVIPLMSFMYSESGGHAIKKLSTRRCPFGQCHLAYRF